MLREQLRECETQEWKEQSFTNACSDFRKEFKRYERLLFDED